MTRLMEVVRQYSAQGAARLRPAGQRLRTFATRMVTQVARAEPVLIAQGRRLGRSLATMLHRGLPLVQQGTTQTSRRLWQMVRAYALLARWVGRLLAGVGVVLSLIFGLFSVYAVVFTRFSVTAEPPLDPADILSTPFIVENAGYLSVDMLRFTCVFTPIEIAPGISSPGDYTNLSVSTDTERFTRSTLDATQRTTIYCSQPLHVFPPRPITSAGLLIELRYRVSWLPLGRDRTQTFYFTTTPDSQGHLRWFP